MPETDSVRLWLLYLTEFSIDVKLMEYPNPTRRGRLNRTSASVRRFRFGFADQTEPPKWPTETNELVSLNRL
jgi:hypothetical protein